MERLIDKGLNSNPVGKAKSVVFTEEGHQKAAKSLPGVLFEDKS